MNAKPDSEPSEATKRFARWLEDGPKLAKEAGCYVEIKVRSASEAKAALSKAEGR